MLKLNHLFENFELAKNCIEYWEHDPAGLEETLGWFRISSNAVYPFWQRAGRLCFLRLCPAAEKPLALVESEIAVIRWLRQEGFAAMEPVPMKDGRLCALLDTPWGSYVASCFGQVTGKPLEDCPLSPGLAEGYGRCLGQLHRLTERCPHGAGRPDHEELLEKIRRRLDEYQAPAGVTAAFRQVCAQLEKLPRSPEVYGLIHYDFQPDNVFYSDADGSFSVIDFDDMLRCWYGVDLVRAMDELPEPLREDFLRGYRSVRLFSHEQQTLLPLMRRLVQLEEYTGLLYALSGEVADPPEWMVQLRSRLTGALRRLEEAISR